MHIRQHRLAAGILVLLAAMPASARDYRAGTLQIEAPWTRATAPGVTVGGGYLVLRNNGARADRLISATSDIAQRVEIHSMTVENGVMRMRLMPDGLEVLARGEVRLAPGGYHIMFIGLKRPLRQGSGVEATLRFQRAGTVRVRFQVEAPGAARPGAGQ